MDFTTLDYLQYGTERQQRAYTVLSEHGVMEKLSEFDPVLAGTIPLNIDTASSDLDIICCSSDPMHFRNVVTTCFSESEDFQLHDKMIGGHPTLIATFRMDGFPVEVFAQDRPVAEQEAFRHMLIEYEVLQEKGEAFRERIIELKKAGVKTEPAFAQLLGLPCVDPYQELLDIS